MFEDLSQSDNYSLVNGLKLRGQNNVLSYQEALEKYS